MAKATQASCFPGLMREGGGRGGGIPEATKRAVCDLVSEDSIPVRDGPKAVTDIFTLINHEAPLEKQLFTHAHIKEWMIDVGSEELLEQVNDFWLA